MEFSIRKLILGAILIVGIIIFFIPLGGKERAIKIVTSDDSSSIVINHMGKTMGLALEKSDIETVSLGDC
ncbi:MAG: hypothetical protein RSB66_04520 [Clostridium sp.]|uniref:hypothetical protein n=1 Tax=Clostridium sp. TaxID=1506 RepID=UPI002FC8D679